jgi:hypothetical protein
VTSVVALLFVEICFYDTTEPFMPKMVAHLYKAKENVVLTRIPTTMLQAKDSQLSLILPLSIH